MTDDPPIEVGALVDTTTGRDTIQIACVGGEVLVRFYGPTMQLLDLEEISSANLLAAGGGSPQPTATLTLSPKLATDFAGLVAEAAALEKAGQPHDDDTEYAPWRDPTILAAQRDRLDASLERYRAALRRGKPVTTAQIAEDLIADAQQVCDAVDYDAAPALTVITMVSLAIAIQKIVLGDGS